DFLHMKGAENSIFAIGDCTATSYAPTAQVASQQVPTLHDSLVTWQRGTACKRPSKASKSKKPSHNRGRKGKSCWRDCSSSETAHQVKLRPFHYSHQGSLAYQIGNAIADLPFMNGNMSGLTAFPITGADCASLGRVATYLFCRSAYLSMLFLLRNRMLIATDRLKVKLFGR
ncbi:hypothetical protein M378DRAFT_1042451, partial [Amanita muscaria Koide BX008]